MLDPFTNTSPRGSIRIEAPDRDLFLLTLTPQSFSELIYHISVRLEVDPAAVRLTYTDCDGQRRMLVGDQRYQQALKDAQNHELTLSVVLVPVIDVRSPSGMIRTSEEKKQMSFEQAGNLARIPHSAAAEEEVKKRLRCILDNSQHYLSSKFKDVLFGLMTSSKLEAYHLDLSSAKIGSYECVLLSEIIQMLPNLQVLSLQNNKIGNEGLTTLCQVIVRQESLEALDLSRNLVSSKGVRTLANTIKKLSQLRFLSVAGNRLRTEDMDLLIDAAPGLCRIVQDKRSECEVM